MEARLIAYKFLHADGTTIFSDFRWPLPRGGRPGEWIEAPVDPCRSGVHACRCVPRPDPPAHRRLGRCHPRRVHAHVRGPSSRTRAARQATPPGLGRGRPGRRAGRAGPPRFHRRPNRRGGRRTRGVPPRAPGTSPLARRPTGAGRDSLASAARNPDLLRDNLPRWSPLDHSEERLVSGRLAPSLGASRERPTMARRRHQAIARRMKGASSHGRRPFNSLGHAIRVIVIRATGSVQPWTAGTRSAPPWTFGW